MPTKKRPDRRPARKHYTDSKRWLTNKAKRIVKQMKKFTNYDCPDNASAELKAKVKQLLKKA